MGGTRYDVLGIGNAIVDILAETTDDFLGARGLKKGTMALIDEPNAEALLSEMGPTLTVSGGSAANTVIGAASLGATACFLGKVRDDHLGGLFANGIRQAGVDFPVPPASQGPATARCFVLVTPDGQRTMNTYLGACQDLVESDVEPDAVAASKIIYLEGYLWDPPGAKAAFLKAARIAHASHRRVALSLSDAFCIGRYRNEFIGLIKDRVVDIVFANEDELRALYEVDSLDAGLASLRDTGVLAAITRSEEGCVILDGSKTVAVPAAPIASLVDTTGAGDLFAAGFVVGLVRGLDCETCGRLGAIAAAEVIQHFGARPQSDLRALAAQGGVGL